VDSRLVFEIKRGVTKYFSAKKRPQNLAASLATIQTQVVQVGDHCFC